MTAALRMVETHCSLFRNVLLSDAKKMQARLLKCAQHKNKDVCFVVLGCPRGVTRL